MRTTSQSELEQVTRDKRSITSFRIDFVVCPVRKHQRDYTGILSRLILLRYLFYLVSVICAFETSQTQKNFSGALELLIITSGWSDRNRTVLLMRCASIPLDEYRSVTALRAYVRQQLNEDALDLCPRICVTQGNHEQPLNREQTIEDTT